MFRLAALLRPIIPSSRYFIEVKNNKTFTKTTPRSFSTTSITVIHCRLTMSPTNSTDADPASIRIATHDGIFHCDEILACFMLQQLPKYAGATIVRTRKDELIAAADIVVDVGSKFDPATHRYDHHQKSFEHTLSSLRPELGSGWTIRLSSAGLVYAHFGEQVIEQIMRTKLHVDVPDPVCVRAVYLKAYETFIRELDAIDNGVPMFDGEPLYRIGTDLCSRVGNFNAAWNAKDGASYNAQEQFERAKQMAGAEFVETICRLTTVWWPARSIVADAIRKRFDVHESGEIIELSEFCPWKEHFFPLETENGCEGVLKYVLYRASASDTRVMAVPVNAKSFVCRQFLHRDWRGLRNEELLAACGIDGAIFVHATGFIGGNLTRAGALEMAAKSLTGPADE